VGKYALRWSALASSRVSSAVGVTERRPFLDSSEAKSWQGRQTMGLFFRNADYRVLNGNPVFGYWDAGGFKWTGNRISWQGIVASNWASASGVEGSLPSQCL